MIHGLPILMSYRKQGYSPDSVWLSIGITYQKPRFKDQFDRLELVANGTIATDDFRAFHSLSVTMFVVEWNQLASDCLERLQKYAKEVTVLCCSYGDDIGFQWSKQFGMLDFGLLGWLEDYHEARTRLCRTEADVKKRVADENEAKSHLPLPPEAYH